MREDTRGRAGRGGEGDGALEILKAWCEVRTGRTPGPSEVPEGRRRPCRAQWGHDLSIGRLLEKLGPKRQFTPVRGETVWKIADGSLDGVCSMAQDCEMVLLYPHCPLMGPQTGGYPDFPNSFGSGILGSPLSPSCIVRANRAGIAP